MSASTPNPAAVIAQLTHPGAPFELTELELGGRRCKAYKNAPPTLLHLVDAARVHGPKEYLCHEGERWSFEQFFAQADALAGWMQAEAGIQPGERVAIAMRNRPQWPVAFVAAVLAGAVPAPVNSLGQGDELCAAVADVSPRLLVCDEERLSRLGPQGLPASCRLLLADEVPAGVHATGWREATAPGGPVRRPVAVQPEDPALLLFTSGSSSRAKAVLSTHRAVGQAMMNIDFIGALSGMTSPQVVQALMARGLAPATLMAVPMFHVSGLHAQLLTSLRNGRRLVIMRRWDAQQALQLIRDEKITQFNGAPTMVMQLMEQAAFDPQGDAKSLAAVGFGGAGLPQRLVDDVAQRFGQSMSGIGFGLTETNGVGTAISGQLFMGRLRSSGLSSPVIELRIAGPGGEPLPAGTAGEVWLRGITVMSGYWQQPEATAQAMVDGWFRSGDVGYLDDEGYLFVVDRLKDVVNRGGEKVAAAEVESCLLSHPGVAEAAVLAMPDAQHGEAVFAVVVPRPGVALDEAELKAHAAARLAAYKVPARMVLRQEALPRTATGKLVKAALKAAYRDA